ncbi:MAG TPA: hydrogenase maturation protease [Candidatus Aminicenantes bacterium]|nr:hydrogenase maturation protease [Candidatus Aminicenantes bacterium]
MNGLSDVLRQGACLVGVGNPLRRDDGVGPWIVAALRAAPAVPGLELVDAQDVPENVVPALARGAASSVVFVDAVAAPGGPGTVVFGPLDEMGEAGSFSTHKMALSLCGKYLEAAGKKAFLLGIVPADLDFGEGLTPAVERAAAAVRDAVLGARAADRPENRHER